MKNKDTDDAQGSYSHGVEIIELNISLGHEEIESNGHRSIVEPIELMKILQREVQKYRVDNERLIRVEEEKY